MFTSSPFASYVLEVWEYSLQRLVIIDHQLISSTWIGSQTTDIEWNPLHQLWIYGRVIKSGFFSMYFLIVSKPLFAVLVMNKGFSPAWRIFDSFALFSARFFDWFTKCRWESQKLPDCHYSSRARKLLNLIPILERLIKVSSNVRFCVTRHLDWIFTSTGDNLRMKAKKVLHSFGAAFFEARDNDIW